MQAQDCAASKYATGMEEKTDMSLQDRFLVVRPILTEKQLREVQAAAEADPNGHLPLFPSHACYLGDEIIGSLSCCVTPVSGLWAHSQKSSARTTIEMVNMARNLTRLITNGKKSLTMCAESSPIYPFMEKMDFVKLGSTTVFLVKEE